MNKTLYRFLACVTLCSSAMAADREGAYPQVNFLSFTNSTNVSVYLCIQPCDNEGHSPSKGQPTPEYTAPIIPQSTFVFNTTTRNHELLKKSQKVPIYYKTTISFFHDALGNESLMWNSLSLGHVVELGYDSDDKKYVLKKRD